MTACVNRKHTKKVAAVVTASLVGALSLGAAPVAAMAEDTGIDVLAVDWFSGATVTKATNGKGGNVSDPSKATFELGSGKYLVPTQITNNNGDVTDVDDNGYFFNYYDASMASIANPEAYFASSSISAGTYYVEIVSKADTTEKTDRIPFKVGAEDKFAGAYAAVNGSKDIVYNGTDLYDDIVFMKADGTKLVQGVDYAAVAWQEADGDQWAGSGLVNAGDYTALLRDYSGDTIATIKFTIAKYDISAMAPSFPDLLYSAATQTGVSYDGGVSFTFNSANPATVNASFLSELLGSNLAGEFGVTSVSAPDGTSGFNGSRGEYAVTVSALSGHSNVTGTATIKFSNLDVNVFNSGVDGYYGSQPLEGLNINLTEGETFDPAKIKVRSGDGKTSYTGDQLEITYYNAAGKKVAASELSKADTYKVVVRVKPFQDFEGTWNGGSKKFTVTVSGNEAYDTNVAFYIDGELAGDDGTVTFDGTDQLDRISAVVKDSEGAEFEFGTDYTFEIEKGGKEVDSIVDAGTYTVTIKPITFSFAATANTGITLTLTVNPMNISSATAQLKNFVYQNVTGRPYVNEALGYTGSALEVPAVAYPVLNADGSIKRDEDGNIVYANLSSDLYNVVSIKKNGQSFKELKDEGTYTVKIALSDKAGDNYVLGDDEFQVQVKKYEPFGDVKSPAWYAPVIETAKANGYVNGISGTNLFAPEADITRADAVCILFNMADGNNAMGDFEYSEDKGWITGFSDVDGNAYYAKALAWANAFGVANGYGDGTFHPYAQITREEFASMLANYAKTMGKFTAAADDALDGVSDANTVSDWAEDNVAWAVENGVMGNGGFVAGQSNITRAEVAAMAVNYQPEAL